MIVLENFAQTLHTDGCSDPELEEYRNSGGVPEKKLNVVGCIVFWGDQPTDFWWQILLCKQEPMDKILGMSI